MNIVKTISTFFESGLRKIKFLRLGKRDIQSSFEAMPYGFDSVPIKNIKAIYSKTGEDGKTVIIGYINTGQLESLKSGESRMFSTDSDGKLSFDIRLKDNGTAEIGGDSDFMVRFNALESGFNELRGDHNSFLLHVHGAAGTPPAPPATPSTASISDAKIEEIKTL